MLSQRDIKTLDDKIYSYEQNWKIDSLFLGEPFITGNILWYKSSRDLGICLYPIHWKSEWKKDAFEVFNTFEKNKFRSLKIWGDRENVSEFMAETSHDWTCFHRTETNSNEYMMAAGTASLKTVQEYRRLKSSGMSLSEKRRPWFSAEQLELLRRCVSIREMDQIDRVFVPFQASLLPRSDVVVYETRLNDKLISLDIVHHFSTKTDVWLTSFRDPTADTSSDFFLGAMYEAKYGYTGRLLMGPCTSAGQHLFKQKWGVPTSAGPIDSYFTNTDPTETHHFSRHLGLWWMRIAEDFLNQ